MKTRLAFWIIGYGCFLILIGVLGYLSNPAKAKTALMSGGTFGLLSILWGWLYSQGKLWSVKAATITTLFLTLVFGWRTVVSWQAVAGGQSEKTTAAVLISLMLAASLALLPALFRAWRTPARA